MAHGHSDRSGDRAGGDRGGENAGPPPPGPPRRAGEAGAHHALIRLATHDSSRTQPAERRKRMARSPSEPASVAEAAKIVAVASVELSTASVRIHASRTSASLDGVTTTPFDSCRSLKYQIRIGNPRAVKPA